MGEREKTVRKIFDRFNLKKLPFSISPNPNLTVAYNPFKCQTQHGHNNCCQLKCESQGETKMFKKIKSAKINVDHKNAISKKKNTYAHIYGIQSERGAIQGMNNSEISVG